MSILRIGIFIVILCMELASCASVSRQLEAAANSTNDSYLPADPKDPTLEQTPVMDLSRYKSVQTRRGQRSDIAFAFAASGGGYRAANLTVGALLGLESLRTPAIQGNMLQEIDYFSSVSGGGFGVGYYLTQLHAYIQNHPADGFSFKETIVTLLQEKSLEANPLRKDYTDQLFFGDKRGLELEAKFNEALFKIKNNSLTLGDIYISRSSKKSVELPYWAANAVIYQNATIFPFSPDMLARYRVVEYDHNNAHYVLRDDFNQPGYATSFPVAVGVTASATVPFAIPATTLTTKGCRGNSPCYLQLLDGGLSDNLGLYTALQFLLEDEAPIKFLMIVDAYKGNVQPYSKSKKPPEGVALLGRVLTVGTDSDRARAKTNVDYVARNLLCAHGARNVIVIYLDLANYPEAKQIGTELSMSLENQKLLIQIGKELIHDNKTLQKFMSELKSGHVRLGRC